ncbi:hypothetical protein ELP17_28310, partial [Klebsiella pneumoniae]|nr:hypothetical protein [Klebsiella pneumoniae]
MLITSFTFDLFSAITDLKNNYLNNKEILCLVGDKTQISSIHSSNYYMRFTLLLLVLSPYLHRLLTIHITLSYT